MVSRSFWESLGYAWAGLRYAVKTQRNMRFHFFATVTVLIAAWLASVTWLELAMLALAITLVLVAEMVNTALETVVNLAEEKFNPMAKVAKDVAAGAVLLASAGAVVIGLAVFLPKLVLFMRSIF